MLHAPTAVPRNRHFAGQLVALCALATAVVSAQASAQRIQLDVHFKVTDLDNKPISGVPARLVLEPDASRPRPDVGTQFVTNANGEYRFTTSAVLDQRRIKRPTNFISSLLSGKEPTAHLTVAAEMPYMQYHWLYVFDVDRFESDATCLMQSFRIFSRATSGQFTVEGKQDRTLSWSMPELNGTMMTRAPYVVSNFSLQPASAKANETHWLLNVSWKKSPDAVMR